MKYKPETNSTPIEYVGAVHYAPDGKTILIKLPEIDHA